MDATQADEPHDRHSDGDQKVSDPVIFSLSGNSDERDRLGVYDDFAADENRPGDFVPGLVNLGFIKAAVRRSVLFVSLMAAVGLVGGLGVYVKYPHSYQATAQVLLTISPYEDTLTAVANNQAMAATSPVATIALKKLGLKESVSNFLSSYTVSSSTARVLTVTGSGPSAEQAQQRTGAVGNAFLTFRANELQAQQDLVVQSLDQQINQAKEHVSSIDGQISQLGQSASSGQQSQLSKLGADRTSAANALANLRQAAATNQTTTVPALTAALKNSQVLSVTPVPLAKKKILVTYLAIGLVAGLVVGLAIVVIGSLISDRLRRRDDVAYALDAPVKLSVRTLRAHRRRVPWPGRAARRNHDLRRVVAHLHTAVPRRTQGAQGLAIVAVDNAPVVAQAVLELATSYAGSGTQVVTADLSSGAHLAHLARVKGPGTHAVSRNGVTFTMAVPERDELAPAGPLPPFNSPPGRGQAPDPLVASDVAADLLLTLATLDPAVGGDHLATWASNAVVVVTSGESSAERIHSVGEMIRLAGMRLDSVVLLGADKSDESLGLTPRPEEQVGMGALGR
jgi:capsular polysaccharide biosynthesis protein